MTAQPLEDARHRMARTLLASGYSVEQAAERSGLERRRVRELADEHHRTPEELLAELQDIASRLPGRAPDVIAEKYAQTIPPDARETALVLALTLLLQERTADIEVANPRNNIQKRFTPSPAPSRKTEIVKDLVQARLDCRVVVDGRQLRFAECTRDQVLALQYKTEDAADALRLHATWLATVAEQMLQHRAGTVAELPEQPRAELMRGKPE
jgi:hypothetical protein